MEFMGYKVAHSGLRYTIERDAVDDGAGGVL
jgi:hypothetical protein